MDLLPLLLVEAFVFSCSSLELSQGEFGVSSAWRREGGREGGKEG